MTTIVFPGQGSQFKGMARDFYDNFRVAKDIFNEFSNHKFSFNAVWDSLIYQQKLYGQIMQSNWYHVGDIQGLNLAKELLS